MKTTTDHDYGYLPLTDKDAWQEGDECTSDEYRWEQCDGTCYDFATKQRRRPISPGVDAFGRKCRIVGLEETVEDGAEFFNGKEWKTMWKHDAESCASLVNRYNNILGIRTPIEGEKEPEPEWPDVIGSGGQAPSEQAASPAPGETKGAQLDDGICVVCGLKTNSLGANPSKWPVMFERYGGNGKLFLHHRGCIVEALESFKRPPPPPIAVSSGQLHPKTLCCGKEYSVHIPYPVYWNPFNKVVQCHNCGWQYKPEPEKNIKEPPAPVVDEDDGFEGWWESSKLQGAIAAEHMHEATRQAWHAARSKGGGE